MTRPVLPLGLIISDSFRMLFQSWTWFFIVPAVLGVAAAALGLAFGFSGQMIGGTIIGTLTAVFTLAAALGLSRGQSLNASLVSANLGPRFLVILLYQITTLLILLGLPYVLGLILFANPAPEVFEAGRLFWQSMNTNDPVASEQLGTQLGQAIIEMDPALVSSLFSRLAVLGALLLLLSLILIALFTPFMGAAVGEDLGFSAVRRSLQLSQGYALKILVIFFVLLILIMAFSFALTMVLGFISALGLGSTAFVLLSSAIFAPIGSLFLIAFVQIYVRLRDIKDAA